MVDTSNKLRLLIRTACHNYLSTKSCIKEVSNEDIRTSSKTK